MAKSAPARLEPAPARWDWFQNYMLSGPPGRGLPGHGRAARDTHGRAGHATLGDLLFAGAGVLLEVYARIRGVCPTDFTRE
jgi:hypothetical protein